MREGQRIRYMTETLGRPLWILAQEAIGPNFYHEGQWYSRQRFALLGYGPEGRVGHIKGEYLPTNDEPSSSQLQMARRMYDQLALRWPEVAAEEQSQGFSPPEDPTVLSDSEAQ